MFQLIQQAISEDSGRDNRYIRGSSIGYCSRQIGYMLLGYSGLPNNGYSQVTLDLGNAIHDMLQIRLVSLGWIKAKPIIREGRLDWEQDGDPLSGCELTVLDHENRIIGHCDGITVPLSKKETEHGCEYLPDPNGERYLIEIKSITDRPNFWVKGFLDGGTEDLIEEENEEVFIDVDFVKTKSTGKIGQKIGNLKHTRTGQNQ